MLATHFGSLHFSDYLMTIISKQNLT